MKKILTIILAAFFAAAGPAWAGESPRIISLYAAHTENLLRLGAKENIIGVSGQESYQGPETAGWNPPVFSLKDDVEKFLAAKPDLVLVRPMHLASYGQVLAALERADIGIWSAQVIKASELYDYWRELGGLVGRGAEADRLIADFEAAVRPYYEAAQRRARRPGVFVEATHQSVKTFTPDSVPAWLISLAGGRNVADDAKPAAQGLIVADYGPERLLAKAAQVEVFIIQQGPMNLASLEDAKKRRIYQPLAAFKTGAVHQIPEAVFARPTPSLLEGLKLLAEWTGLAAEMRRHP